MSENAADYADFIDNEHEDSTFFIPSVKISLYNLLIIKYD